jgi:hypothetical protein
MAKASARHILVSTQEECQDIKNRLKTELILPSWLKNDCNVLPGNRGATWVNSARAKWSKNLIRLYLAKKSGKSADLSGRSLDFI